MQHGDTDPGARTRTGIAAIIEMTAETRVSGSGAPVTTKDTRAVRVPIGGEFTRLRTAAGATTDELCGSASGLRPPFPMQANG